MRTPSETPRSTGLLSDARLRSSVVVLLVALGILALSASASASAAPTGVLAWGENVRGELGDGATERSDVPVAVSGLSGVTAVSAGADFSLALLSDGTVMAWGENGFGQLGNATAGEDSYIPVPVNGLGEVTQVAAGGNHALALLRNGTVVAWGYNAFGQLGDGKTGYEGSSHVPVPVSGLERSHGRCCRIQRQLCAVTQWRGRGLGLQRIWGTRHRKHGRSESYARTGEWPERSHGDRCRAGRRCHGVAEKWHGHGLGLRPVRGAR